MKWVLIYVLYAHTSDAGNRSASLAVSTNHIVFDDEAFCKNAAKGIISGGFNHSYNNNLQPSSNFIADAACVPQSSTNGPVK